MGVGFDHRGMAFTQINYRLKRYYRSDKLMIAVDTLQSGYAQQLAVVKYPAPRGPRSLGQPPKIQIMNQKNLTAFGADIQKLFDPEFPLTAQTAINQAALMPGKDYRSHLLG
jgi:hypothetical protein